LLSCLLSGEAFACFLRPPSGDPFFPSREINSSMLELALAVIDIIVSGPVVHRGGSLPATWNPSPEHLASAGVMLKPITALTSFLQPSAWRLDPEPSTFAPKGGYSNKDMDPVPPHLRTWTAWNFVSTVLRSENMHSSDTRSRTGFQMQRTLLFGSLPAQCLPLGCHGASCLIL